MFEALFSHSLSSTTASSKWHMVRLWFSTNVDTAVDKDYIIMHCIWPCMVTQNHQEHILWSCVKYFVIAKKKKHGANTRLRFSIFRS